MAFSDFKHISQVQEKYQIVYQEDNFMSPKPMTPPASYVEEFTFNRDNLDIYASEASRSELVILPTLREVYKPYVKDYMLWVQKPLHVDTTLSGKPDYMISTRSTLGKTVLATPIVIVVEAKRNDFDQGWAQCLAELVAAQIFNKSRSTQLEQEPVDVYGIVTDAKSWEFGRLTQNVFTKHRQAFTIEPLEPLFGVLGELFEVAT
ncbi:MAG: hypothetical protein AAF639_15025 [Chloroflexota bacterium]